MKRSVKTPDSARAETCDSCHIQTKEGRYFPGRKYGGKRLAICLCPTCQGNYDRCRSCRCIIPICELIGGTCQSCRDNHQSPDIDQILHHLST